MQGPLKDKNDIKIFILYLLRNIGYPLDFDNINDIVVQDGIVGYFDFADCFAELLDTGNIAEEKEGVLKVAKVNVDETPALAQQFGIVSIPTLIVMKNGEVVKQVAGARPKAQILSMLEG